ncbi:hypothetical protein BIWAKO_06459 [Bosea sp. BIWAKO-01]|nr:hypothetical protein BIWAKO_06459 [Bosea sp. BIWAKO-01]
MVDARLHDADVIAHDEQDVRSRRRLGGCRSLPRGRCRGRGTDQRGGAEQGCAGSPLPATKCSL